MRVQWILFIETARQLHSGNGRHTAKRTDVCAKSNGGQLQMFVSSQLALYVPTDVKCGATQNSEKEGQTHWKQRQDVTCDSLCL
jgi:hypothetical protein